ncbi:MAG: hypothetical protein ACKPGB_01825, partial [Dolichospermum sp.]
AYEVLSGLQIQQIPPTIIASQLPVSPNSCQQVSQFISPPVKPPVYPHQNENLGNGVVLEMVAIPGENSSWVHQKDKEMILKSLNIKLQFHLFLWENTLLLKPNGKG